MANSPAPFLRTRWTIATLIVTGWLAFYVYWLASDTQPACQITTVTQTGSSAHMTKTRGCGLPSASAFVYVLAPVALLLVPDAKSIRLGIFGFERNLPDLEDASKVAGAAAKGDTLDDSEPADAVFGPLLGGRG